MKCPKCGNEIGENQKFCTSCGTELNVDDNQNITEENSEQDIEELKNKTLDKMVYNPNVVKIITCVVLFLILCCFVFFTALKIHRENMARAYEQELYKNAQQEYAQNNLDIAKENADRLPYDKQEYKDLRNKIYLAIYLRNGDEAVKNKDYKKAISEYRQAEQLSKQSVEKKLNLAISLRKALYENKTITSYDKIREITWIFDKELGANVKRNIMFIYIGKNAEKYWLNFCVSYHGKFIFWNTMTFNIDGEIFTYKVFDNIRTEDTGGWNQWEHADLNYEGVYKNDNLLNKIINSQHTYLRLQNSEKQYDREVSDVEKQAMKRMLDYYDYITE